MAQIDVRIFTLMAQHEVALFTARGERQPLNLTFAGRTDTDRGEDQLYKAEVPAGVYWMISPCADGSVKLARVTAREVAGRIVEGIARASSPMRDADVAAFAGTCAKHEIPESVSQDFLRRLQRVTSQQYMAARRH